MNENLKNDPLLRSIMHRLLCAFDPLELYYNDKVVPEDELIEFKKLYKAFDEFFKFMIPEAD